MKYALLLCLCFIILPSNAQEFDYQQNDTIKNLLPVIITSKIQSPERMPEIKENILFSGKKK